MFTQSELERSIATVFCGALAGKVAVLRTAQGKGYFAVPVASPAFKAVADDELERDRIVGVYGLQSADKKALLAAITEDLTEAADELRRN